MTEEEFKLRLAEKDKQISAAVEATTATVLEVDRLKQELQVANGTIVSLEQLVHRLSQQAASLTDHNTRLHSSIMRADTKVRFWRARYHEALDDLALIGAAALPIADADMAEHQQEVAHVSC